jgi:hypothetical protein
MYLGGRPALERWRGGLPIAEPLLSWAGVVVQSVCDLHIDEMSVEVIDRLNIFHSVAFAMRCIRQIGIESMHFTSLIVTAFETSVTRSEYSPSEGQLDLAIEIAASGYLNYKFVTPELRRRVYKIIKYPYLYELTTGDTWNPFIAHHQEAESADEATLIDQALLADDDLMKARFFQAHGTLLYIHCKWAEADASLQRAYEIAVGEHALDNKAIAIETARRGIELGIVGGRDELSQKWSGRLESLQRDEEWEAITLHDRTLDFLIQQTQLNLKLSEIFRRGPWAAEQERDAELDGIISAYEELIKGYLHAPLASLRGRMLYNFGRALALVDTCRAITVFHAAHELVHQQEGWDYQCGILLWAESVVSVAHRLHHDEESPQETHRNSALVAHYGLELINKFGSWFWGTKAIAASVALAELSRSDFTEEEIYHLEHMAAALPRHFDYINRSDLHEITQRVATGDWSPVWLLAD